MSDDSRRRLWRIRTAAAWIAGVLFIGYVLLNCSGFTFPLLRPTADLRGVVDDEYGVELPASAVVNHGSRQASMRTIRFYDVQMNPAEVQPFVDALRIGAERHGKLAVKRD